MSIQTNCPGCKALYRLPDTQQGKRVRCKQCQVIFVVTPASATDDVPVLEDMTEDEFRSERSEKVENRGTPPSHRGTPRSRDEDDRPRRRDPDDDSRPPRRPSWDDDEDRPHRSRGEEETASSTVPLLVGAMCAMFFLLSGGGALAWYFTRSSNKPSSTQAIVTKEQPPVPGAGGAGQVTGPAPTSSSFDWNLVFGAIGAVTGIIALCIMVYQIRTGHSGRGANRPDK
jgi:predicted Zn finger-like uncharacterized protein